MKIRLHITFLLAVMVALSCKKENSMLASDLSLNLSEDIIHFDTIFTSVGSVTQYFKLYNAGKHTIKLNKVSLAGGHDSRYHINVDGVEGPDVLDAEIGGKDSLYVFVSVKIDPNSANLPFLIEDSISVDYGNGTKWVRLQAWGQNANFIRGLVITGNKLWTNTKPYVIIGGLKIAETGTLTIQQGAKIYLHADAPVIVDGTLHAKGAKYDSTHIVFRSDRLDEGYRDFPGSWPGIFFRDGSVNNVLEYVEIRNAYQGIVTQGPTADGKTKLALNACIIDNCYDAGLIAVNSGVEASNCLISNCGKNIVLLQGGQYSFTHCTDVAVSNPYILYKDPVLSLTDYFKQDDNVSYGDMDAEFINCIFWGENSVVEDEVAKDKAGSGAFDVRFLNSIWTMKTVPAEFTTSAMLQNVDPMFLNTETKEGSSYDFRLQEKSPAIGAGISTNVTTDLKGNPRDPINPDAGAYEYGF